jgi:4-diphosphocytidyl-2-C-methyl-D-erythritol kinase
MENRIMKKAGSFKALRVEAPCKINLHLRVKNRRSDGFHELESIFAALAFGDTLEFEVSPGVSAGRPGAIRLESFPGASFTGNNGPENAIPGNCVPGNTIPLEKNLVYRAAALFQGRTGFPGDLNIRLHKRIPLGAGLGGGSTDAAATLRALNVLADSPLTPEELLALAGELGSDVPFFLHGGGAAWVTGRGERVLPIAGPPPLPVVLVFPGFHSGTPEAFRLLDRVRQEDAERAGPREAALSKAALAGQAELRAALLGLPPAQWPYGNDFLSLFLRAGPRERREAYLSLLGELTALGADFAGLSGSGSACFGVWSDEGGAQKAASALSRGQNFVQSTFFLARSGNTVLE